MNLLLIAVDPSLRPWLVIIGAILIAGVVAYFIHSAPFVSAEYKQPALWVLALLCALFVITRVWALLV